jgi:hypothetical protein
MTCSPTSGHVRRPQGGPDAAEERMLANRSRVFEQLSGHQMRETGVTENVVC